jgi:hypothetical protein
MFDRSKHESKVDSKHSKRSLQVCFRQQNSVRAQFSTAGGWCCAAPRARRPADGDVLADDGAPRAAHDGWPRPGGWWRVAHNSATAGAGPAEGYAPCAARRARRLADGGAPRAEHNGWCRLGGWWLVAHRSANAGAGPADGGAREHNGRRRPSTWWRSVRQSTTFGAGRAGRVVARCAPLRDGREGA